MALAKLSNFRGVNPCFQKGRWFSWPTRFCPAAIEGIVDDPDGPEGTGKRLNAANCVHCKTCGIKDPYAIIRLGAAGGWGGAELPEPANNMVGAAISTPLWTTVIPDAGLRWNTSIFSPTQGAQSMSSKDQCVGEDEALRVLSHQLTARNMSCADLSAQQVKLAKLAEKHLEEATALRAELQAQAQLMTSRHRELGVLTERVLELENELAKARAASEASQNALSDLEKARDLLEQAAERQTTHLADMQRRLESAGTQLTMATDGQAILRAQLTFVQVAREHAVVNQQHHMALLREHSAATHAQLMERCGRGLMARLGSALRPLVTSPPPQFPESPPESDVAKIRECPVFDGKWYEQQYSQYSAGMDPARHYCTFGVYLGFDPGPEFSTTGYLRCNSDVAKAGFNPLLHYLEFGQSEGRRWNATQKGSMAHR